MTDTYVEKLLINKFLELTAVESVVKCYQYFQNNKESEDPLESFEAFMPDYPEGASDEDKLKIDGPLITNLIKWYRDTYPEYYGTPEGDSDDDKLYDAISAEVIDLSEGVVKEQPLYNEDGVLESLVMYPNVNFPNTEFTRPVNELGDNTPWYDLFFIPSSPNYVELGQDSRMRWTGLLQVNICVPKDWGTDDLYARYDEIAALFKSGLIIEGVRIHRTYRSSALDNDDFYWLPVTIEWQADLDR